MTKYLSFKQAIQVLRVPRVTRSARDSDLFIELSGTPPRPAPTSSSCPAPSNTNFPLRFLPFLPSFEYLYIFESVVKTRDVSIFNRISYFSLSKYTEISQVNTRARLSIFYLRVTQRSLPTGKILRRPLI